MEKDNVNSTPVIPKKKLRLGLGRNRSGSQTTPGFRIQVRQVLWTPPKNVKTTATKVETTTTTPTNRNDEVESPDTLSPSKLANSTQTPNDFKNNDVLHRKAASATLCRPYCLTFNRKIRKTLTKKRLQFYLANEACEDEENNQPTESDKADAASSANVSQIEQQNTGNHDSKEGSTATADALPSTLETASDIHAKKLNDLKDSIATWKAGFVATLTELQKNLEPRLEFPVLLAQLKITPEMIKYLD